MNSIIKAIELLENRKQRPTLKGKLKYFYTAIKEGLVLNDKEACIFLFDCDPCPPYYQLKHNLRTKINQKLSTLTEPRNCTPIRRAMDFCRKEIAVLQSVRINGIKGEYYFQRAEKILNTALEYDFIDIALDISRYLLKNHTFWKHRRDYAQLKSLLTDLQQKQNAEIYLDLCYADLFNAYSGRVDLNIDDQKIIDDSFDKLKMLAQSPQTYKFYAKFFNIAIIRAQHKGDYKQVKKYAEQALIFFKGNNKSSTFAMISIYNTLITYSLRKGLYQEAKNYSKESIQILTTKGRNWSTAHHYRIIIALHSKEYQDAFDIFYDIKNDIKYLDRDLIEQWKIVEAYLFLFAKCGKIKTKNKRFRLGKFINEVPVYSKDKSGHNTNILILQFLFRLKEGKRNKLIDSTNVLNKYVQKNLRNDETLRSQCFLKMLLSITSGKGNFHPLAAQRRAERYIKKLQANPLDKSKQGTELEIVPYYDLWELALEILEPNKVYL